MSSFSGLDQDNLWRRVEGILDSIEHDENRQTIRRYLKERLASGISASTLGNDANALRGLCLHLKKKRLADVTRDDVVDYVTHAYVQRAWKSRRKDGTETVTTTTVRVGPATLSIRKIIIRDFMRWLRGTGDEYPPEVRGIKIGRVQDEDYIPVDQLIERPDLVAMIQDQDGLQEKARLAVLHESGLRAGEFCALCIDSVSFDKYGAVLTLPKKRRAQTRLKTGARRIRLFESVPYLLAWYEAHPMKKDPRAPLFFGMSRRAPRTRLTPTALWKFCVDAGEGARIRKHTNPHLFRHSAATERARRGWNEARMRAFFGWSKNSDMPSRYVHLAGKDHEQADLEERGLLDSKDRAQPALAPVLCPACNASNLPTALFCQGCRAPIAPEAEEELERRRQEDLREAAAAAVANMSKDEIAAMVYKLMTDRKGSA